MLFQKKSSSSVDYMIVGLGNPGFQYESTRHNAGFIAVDMLAKKHGCDLSKNKHKALFGQCDIDGKRCLLVKPQTFMNNSGEAVGELSKFYKVPPENVIVLFDDISLDVGKLRIRRKGSDGGHNGIKSIIYYIGSNFPRVKIGVGAKPHPDYDLAAWVLSKFSDDEKAALSEAAEHACSAVELMVGDRTDKAMNKFNS